MDQKDFFADALLSCKFLEPGLNEACARIMSHFTNSNDEFPAQNLPISKFWIHPCLLKAQSRDVILD